MFIDPAKELVPLGWENTLKDFQDKISHLTSQGLVAVHDTVSLPEAAFAVSKGLPLPTSKGFNFYLRKVPGYERFMRTMVESIPNSRKLKL